MSADITPILMPKWGLSMKEGTLADWHVEEGTQISPGDEIMDVETDKIANVVEAADGGLLRRRVGLAGTVYPVRALLGVMAPETVTDAEINAYVDGFEMPVIEDEDREFVAHAMTLLPEGPFDDTTWSTWTADVKEATGRKGKGLFMPLRKALTGQPHGPEMAQVLPLLQKIKARG